MNLRNYLVCLGIVLTFAAGAVHFCRRSHSRKFLAPCAVSCTIPSTVPFKMPTVDLKAQRSDWVQHQKTNADGEFEFSAVPLGEYTVTVTITNFQTRDAKRRRDLRIGSSFALRNGTWRALAKKQLSPGNRSAHLWIPSPPQLY